MKAQVRIYYPHSSAWIGHYDLYIDGTYYIGSKKMDKKVLSYAPLRNSSRNIVKEGSKTLGCLYIFDKADTAGVLYGCRVEGNCTIYTYTFDITQTQADALGSFMSNYLGAAYGSTGLQYLVTGPFKYYTREAWNCFHATAVWCNKIGYGKLLEIYDKYTTSYESYLPTALFPIYKNYWAAYKKYVYNANTERFTETNP